jgi:regulator of sigma E protease
MHHFYDLVRTIIEFAIVLGIMVLVHEFGHFIVAKMCGVRIETFSIGFGTRLFGYTHNGTDYRIAALPLGGYVKMAGEMGGESATGAPDEFTSKTRFQRILIALAGPAANFVLSFFLLFLVAHYHHEIDQYLNGPAVVDYVPLNTPAAADGIAAGDTITHFGKLDNPTWQQILQQSALNLNLPLPMTYIHNGQTISREITIHIADPSDFSVETLSTNGLIAREQAGPVGVLKVEANTPASRAGLQPGDSVARIDNLDIHSVITLLAYLRDRDGAPAVLSVLRNGRTLHMVATPEKLESPGAPTQYRLGFQPTKPPVDIEQLPFKSAVKQSLKDNRDDSKLIFSVLQGMFTRHVSVKSLSGPVGIAQQIDMATQLGVWTLLMMMATISINLAIFNLLPFPPLDGGMIFFLLIESLIRRDVNQQVKERIYQLAFVCIIFLAIFVMFNDITRLHIGKP